MPHHSEIKPVVRFFQVFCAILWCFFAAGPVFGFAALKPVLVSEGVYQQFCTPDELAREVPICAKQELKLNMMFTLAAVLTNVAALPIGVILDKYGPKVAGLIGSGFLFLAALVLRDAAYITLFDPYVVGYILLALGGPFVFISSFQLSNAFPDYSGTVLALLTGAFDASSALFLFYRLIYEKGEASGGTPMSLNQFFTCYLVVPVFILSCQLFLMPKESYRTVADKVADIPEDDITSFGSRRLSLLVSHNVEEAMETTGLLRNHRLEQDRVNGAISPAQRYTEAISDDQDDVNTSLILLENPDVKAASSEDPTKKSGVWGALHGCSAGYQLKSPWFLLMAFFTTIQMLRINYFVATIYSQYSYLFHSYQEARELNKFFDIALPLGGVISIPFIGLVLDNFSTLTVLSTLYVLSLVIGVLGLFPYHITGILNVCMIVAYRPFYYTTVSDYSAKVFGFETFGTVYGLIIATAGLMNLMQSPLDRITHIKNGGNPTPVNIVLVSITCVAGGLLLTYVYTQLKTIKRRQLEIEAESAPVEAMPGALPA